MIGRTSLAPKTRNNRSVQRGKVELHSLPSKQVMTVGRTASGRARSRLRRQSTAGRAAISLYTRLGRWNPKGLTARASHHVPNRTAALGASGPYRPGVGARSFLVDNTSRHAMPAGRPQGASPTSARGALAISNPRSSGTDRRSDGSVDPRVKPRYLLPDSRAMRHRRGSA